MSDVPEMWVWVFNGSGIRKPYDFPSAVFSSRDLAEQWIRRHGCTGVLTRYPVNVGAYDWALKKGYFKPKKPHHYSAAFIETFSDASQEHYHYECGVDESDETQDAIRDNNALDQGGTP